MKPASLLPAVPALMMAALVVAACAGGSVPEARAAGIDAAQTPAADTPEMDALINYLRSHGTTGFIVVQNGELLINRTWRPPEGDAMFANFVYGVSANGYLLEDVASQQKSFIAVLAAIAVDRGLLDVERSVTSYLGAGWSQATPDQEAEIRVIDVLTMSSGLDEQFRYSAAPESTFFYNTPVYAVSKRILTAASGQTLEAITTEWLTTPVGMSDTAWRRRPAALASVGNDTGLVTTPLDVARFGLMIMDGGVNHAGERVVSREQLQAMFAPSQANPSYGRLWWLNSGAYSVRAAGARRDGPLVPAAPTDMVGAYGAFDRRLYIVPSRNLVIVRTGAATNEHDFDQRFWLLLNDALG